MIIVLSAVTRRSSNYCEEGSWDWFRAPFNMLLNLRSYAHIVPT